MTCPIFTISPDKVVELLSAVKQQMPADMTEQEIEALHEFSMAVNNDLYSEMCRRGEEGRDRHPVTGFGDDWYEGDPSLTWADSWLVSNAISALTGKLDNRARDWPIWRDALAELDAA